MHRIDRGAQIHRDNQRSLSVSAPGVVPVTTVVFRGFVLLDRRGPGQACSAPQTFRAIAYGVTWNQDTVNGIGSGDEGLAGAHDGELAKAVKDNVH
jgi:hypothetical protein